MAATRELEPRLGRSPTAQEIAAHLDIALEDVVEALTVARSFTPVSLQQPLDNGHDAGQVGDRLGREDADLRRRELALTLREASDVLSQRDRIVLYLRFAADLPQHDIARRVGVSQMQVSRIIRAGLERIGQRLPYDYDLLAA